MSKWLAVLILSCTSRLVASAAEGEYAVSKIPPALLLHANAVLRVEEQRFEIIHTGKAVLRHHYVITILDESGDDRAEFSEYYDKFRKIESIEGILYNAAGNQLKKIKTKDAEDLSGVADFSLIDDNRIKRHNFYQRVYPYTVEYTTEIEFSSTLFFPQWVPQEKDRLSVEKSTCTIVVPAGYQFRYKAFNYNGTPVLSTEKDKSLSAWMVKDIPAILREPYSPLWHELTTVVIFGPTDFQVEDYKGNMNSWADFGKFVNALREGKDLLPDPVKQEVHRLTDALSDIKQKIAVLYEYLQKNTRYISIQLGIGGWRPFDAKFVAAKAYGDCKALTNYMYSLLKEAGILSNYSLIRAGENAGYITDDFPSQQFNHVILCVPMAKDTIWLECTSSTLSPGYLSDFTCNRYALLVDQNGGRLVRTPAYGLKENQQQRNITATLDQEAALQIHAVTRYTGLEQDDIHGMIHHLSKEKVKEYLHEELDFPTYEINRFQYEEEKTTLPGIIESLDISVSNYATITGKRLFIVPNIMTRSNTKLPADEERKFALVFQQEYGAVDSVVLLIPEGYTTESMPKDVSLSTRFGTYHCSVKLTGNKIIYTRRMEKFSGRFPATTYRELVDFYETIYKADRNRIVLVKQESTKGF